MLEARKSRITTTQLGGGERQSAGILDNLGVLWKIGLLSLVLALGTLVLLLVNQTTNATLSYHTNNLYEFELLPINSLQEARISSIATVRTLEVLQTSASSLDQEQVDGVLEQSLDYSKRLNAVLEQYEKLWITTIKPEFTALLKAKQQTKLQDREVLQFGELKTLNNRMKTSLAAFIKTKGKNGEMALAELTGGYFEISDRLQDLVSLNLEFAKLSAADADEASAASQRNSILVFLAILVFGALLVFLIGRSITLRLSKLESAARELRSGNLDVQSDVRGRDEIGSVSTALNASITQLRAVRIEQDLERQKGVKLQENVSEFLNVAMDIAGGDLTKKGAVTDDVLGNVVDAINIMTDEFGVLLGNVRSAAERVSSSANSMTQTSQGILENAQSQASLAQGAQNQTNLVAQAMQSLAATADKGASAAQFTLEASSAGTQAVTQTREQLVQIRDQMLSMTQGMQGLARRSDEISEVVRTISRFASQTNLLALGASLEAAGAGTAGARFGAVANAVRSLADDSAKAASRITSIVKDVQNEIQTLSGRATVSAEQVQMGTQVAAQASERLERISDLARQSVQVASDIASLASQQAESVEVVRENVTRIVKTAQVTETNTRQGGVAAGELQTLSQSLSQSLERFRLPA